MSEDIPPPPRPRTAADFALLIGKRGQRTVETIFEAADLCVEAMRVLQEAGRAELVQLLGISDLSKRVTVANDDRLRSEYLYPMLPPSFSTIHLISGMTIWQLKGAIDDGVLHPGMSRKTLERWLKSDKKMATAPVVELPEVATVREREHLTIERRAQFISRMRDFADEFPEVVITGAKSAWSVVARPLDKMPLIAQLKRLCMLGSNYNQATSP